METINCHSWEEFEEKASAIFQDRAKKKGTSTYTSEPLFRGQENAAWKLETTLERFGKPNFEMEDYHHIIESLIPAVTSLTEKPWVLAGYSSEDLAKPKPPPGYEFMVYLRHHGFPSPLLDWTRSPYVAAFFAFRSQQKATDKNVAIYSYVEYPEGEKRFSGGKASIVGLGPYITTHKRHYTQQCEYTICKKYVDKNHVYCPHEEAFSRNTQSQDRLTKFILPKSERTKVLEKLNFMNVNAYSLFGNEEGLMETLAYQEIEKRYP